MKTVQRNRPLNKRHDCDKIAAMLKSIRFVCLYLLLLLISTVASAQTAMDNRGTLKRPIVDSRMKEKEAFDGLDPNCPPEIRRQQKIVKLKYFSFDGKIHQGQLVIDKDLVRDIKKIFKF